MGRPPFLDQEAVFSPRTKKTKTTFFAVMTRMDTPKYDETLKYVYIKYQPILVLPKVYQV